MNCSSCGHDNPSDGRFCTNCGAALAQPNVPPKCPNCDHEVSTDSTFCSNCGTALVRPSSQSTCPNCGQNVPAGSTFCSNCGTPIGQSCPNCAQSVDLLRGGKFCRLCQQFLAAPKGITVARLGPRVGAYLFDFVIFNGLLLFLIIGFYFSIILFTFFFIVGLGVFGWWLFTLSRGQTPGKQLLGIRVMRTDGTASDWGWTFIRELLVKEILFRGIAWLTVIGGLLDLLWAFWDKDRQTLHDKIVKTVVVDDRGYRLGNSLETSPPGRPTTCRMPVGSPGRW